MSDFLKRLGCLQCELKAPKSQYNKFGKFAYRSAEDILEAVKPLCSKYGFVLLLSDELTMMGERYYIKATARLMDIETNESVECFGYAREQEEKAGMDESQITGSASSYARKYALNGLFNCADNDDADAINTYERTEHNGLTEEALVEFCKNKKAAGDDAAIKSFYRYYTDKVGQWTGSFDFEKKYANWKNRNRS